MLNKKFIKLLVFIELLISIQLIICISLIIIIMLLQADVSHIINPNLILLSSSLLLSVATLIILTTQSLTGFNQSNFSVQLGSTEKYFSDKYSTYNQVVLKCQFVIVCITIVLSSVSMLRWLRFKTLMNKAENQEYLGQKSLRLYFVTDFVQLVFIITILARNIQFFVEIMSTLHKFNGLIFILIVINLIKLIILSISTIIYFKLHQLLRNKLSEEQKIPYYNCFLELSNDQSILEKIEQNNKIKELSQSSESSNKKSLRHSLLKQNNSIYKQYSPTKRSIPYKLKGGKQNSDQNSQKISNLDMITPQKQIINRLTKPKQLNTVKKRNLLSVDQEALSQNPNQQYPNFTMNSNLISINLSDKKQDLNSSIDKNTQIIRMDDSSIIKIHKVESQKSESIKSTNKQKKTLSPTKQKSQFNLAPISQTQKNINNNKNPQNVDEAGRFYYIDMQKYQKKKGKSAKLSKQIVQDDQIIMNSPSALQKVQKPRKPQRQTQNHKKFIEQAFIKVAIQKQKQLQLYKDQSQYQSSYQDFEQDDLIFQLKQSSPSQQQQIKQNLNQKQKQKQDTLDINKIQEKPIQLQQSGQIKAQNQEPNQQQLRLQAKEIQSSLKRFQLKPDKLHLHIQRKKVVEQRLRYRLYQDQQLQGQPSEQSYQAYKSKFGKNQFSLSSFPSQNSELERQKQQKQKQKIRIQQFYHFKNKIKITPQAKMLRFIKDKYGDKQEQEHAMHKIREDVEGEAIE